MQHDIRLQLLFKDSYTEISQSPAYTVPSLFGELGGLLGLFVGASMMTVMEMAELLYSFIAVCLGKIQQGKVRRKVEEENVMEEVLMEVVAEDV